MNANQPIVAEICCSQCRETIPPQADFCPHCGQPAAGKKSSNSDSPNLGSRGLNSMVDMATMMSDGETVSPEPQLFEVMSPGEVFAARYQIIEVVGAGGMGIVYRVFDQFTEQDMALKLIRPGRQGKSSELERIKQEGITSRKIRHENVVSVYDINEHQGQPYITMEYLPGRSLREMLTHWKASGTDIPFACAAEIVRQILQGLQAAHAMGVIHRDLKPENIIVTREDQQGIDIKIVDFGIARAIESTPPSPSGSTAGTFGYMAPEQLVNAELAGPAADVYAIAVMFYEMLVGAIPSGHWQPPSEGRQDVPASINKLIQQCIATKSSLRLQTANEFLQQLSTGSSEKPHTDKWFSSMKERVNQGMEPATKLFGMERSKGWTMYLCIALIIAAFFAFDSDPEPTKQDNDQINRNPPTQMEVFDPYANQYRFP